MKKKFLLFAIVHSMLILPLPAKELVEHKNILKNFHWPTPITITHFITFTEAAPLGLNIFEMPDEAGEMVIKWQDNVSVKVVRNANGYWVENINAGVWSCKKQLPAGKLEAATDGRGVTFRSSDQKLNRFYGGLAPNDLTVCLPQGVKAPEVRSIYVIDDILLYLSACEAEKVLNKALKLFNDQKNIVEKSPIYSGNRYSWTTNIRLNINNLARVKAEAEAKLLGFLPALLNDPIVRDRCNWVFYMAMRQGASTGGYFGGRFYQIWSDKLPGRGEVLSAMYFADMLEKLVAKVRRHEFASAKEAYNYQDMLSGGMVSALEYVPKQAGLPVNLQKKAALRCARGEAESVQLVLAAAGKNVDNVTLSVSAKTADAPALELDRIEFVNLTPAATIQIPLNRGYDLPEPDVCIPVKKGEKFSIAKYTNQPFLLTAQTQNGTVPGTYKYVVTVTADGKKAFELPITVKVEDFALQERIPSLPGLRAEYFKTFYPDKKMAKTARINLMKAMLKHRMAPLNLYRPSPLAEDLEWTLNNGVKDVLLDGKLEKLADPREEMPQYIELYGSVDGKKFERIPADVKLDRRDKKNPVSALDIFVTVKGDTQKYKYCKLHYSQPTDMQLKGHIYYYEAMCKGRKTMLVNGKTMLKNMRFIQPDKNKAATWDQAKNAGLVKFDLLNNKLYGASIFWENSVGEIKTLRLYNVLRDKQIALLKPFYDKVRAIGGNDINVYLYGFDERGERYNKPMLSAMKTARQVFGNVKFVTTATNPEADPELFKYLDVHCRSIGKSDIQLNMQTAKTYGTDYWYYIGGGPYYPFGNFERVDQPRINSRAFFWAMIAYDHLKGWLYWAINYWSGNEHLFKADEIDWSLWSTNHGSFNGMRSFFYPGKNGEIYPSLRASAMRDGLEDVELFRIAQKLVKTREDKAALETIRNGYATGLSSFCGDIKMLEKNRNKLYDLLVKLSPKVKVTQLEFDNFNTGKNSLFHPAVTPLKDGRWLATVQKIMNSDFYGEPEYTISSDQGKSWSKLQKIDALNYRKLPDSKFIEAVADNRPFTLQNGSVVVFGCKTHYTEKGRAGNDPANQPYIPAQFAYYTIWDPATGKWSDRMKLDLPGLKHYRAACTQAVLLDDDKIIVPHYLSADQTLGELGTPKKFGVLTAIYQYKNGKLHFLRRSRIMTNNVKRGLIEPSIVQLPDKSYALTIRAEDGMMYCAFSKNAVDWSEPTAWCWDDGTKIRTSSTQQHWVTLNDRVFLVYTRFDGTNFPLPLRFRGPLYMAEAVPGKAILLRNSEVVVFPRKNLNGMEGRYGNFHCTQLSKDKALITDALYFARIVGPRKHGDISCEVKAARITVD